MNNLGLYSPWVEQYKKFDAFFKNDPNVKVVYDNDAVEVKLYVTGAAKADALIQLLPASYEYGNVTLKITIVPSNNSAEKYELLFDALAGNTAFSTIYNVEGAFNSPLHYVTFKPEIAQYHNDDLGDVYGNRTTLYQEIAKEIFGEEDGLFYCTERVN